MKLDWKFLLTLLATVAGVAVPVWLWQADQSSKSLSIKLATRISIQPKEQGTISGVEISVDGARLVNPHLVVLEIRNNGSKPIPAADFESPVKINVVSETKLVRANITDKVPKDIEAALVSDSEGMSLKPTLLNSAIYRARLSGSVFIQLRCVPPTPWHRRGRPLNAV